MSQIRTKFQKEETPVSLVLICKLLKKFKINRSDSDCKRRASAPKRLGLEHLCFIDDRLAEDNELAAIRLNDLLE